MFSYGNLITWLLVLISSSFQVCDSANILFFFTGGTYSHDISIWPLVIRLAEKDHSVTFYSAHSQKPWNDTRIRIVAPEQISQINDGYLSDTVAVRFQYKEAALWQSVADWSYAICKYIVTDPGKPESRVLFNDQKYDLVILDSVLCDCGHIVAYYHGAKVIVSDSTSVLPWFHGIYGFPAESNWVPATTTFFQYPMGVLNVIQNYFEPLYWSYVRQTQFYPKLEALLTNLMDSDNVPSFLELERRAKLVFVNTHPSVEFPRSLPPNVIQIGGMQIWGQTNASIPKELTTFIDEAEEGIILITFGSSLDFAVIPETTERAFFDAFRNFPKIHFITKASSTKPAHAPKNLRYENWVPQKEVLAHPKTLACISHGGLNGIIEATYLGIPLIMVPIFAEQDHQSYKLQARKVGIRLELRDLNEKDLTDAISNITTNNMYQENMKVLQAAFLDRPQTPLDLAEYWVGFVLKHEDMSFMNPITYQPWTVFLGQYMFSIYSVFVAGLVTIVITGFMFCIFVRFRLS